MSRAEKTHYDDIDKASAALKWAVEKIESYLSQCLNAAENNGTCDLTWRHDHCKTLMDILYDLTEDPKYKEKEWVFDSNKKSLWD